MVNATTLNKILIVIIIILVVLNIMNLLPHQEVYLSDLEELNILEAEWKDPQRDQSIDNNRLVIDDRHFSKGLGVHAISRIAIDVPSGAKVFQAHVGIDDEVEATSPASVRFSVLGDGAVLWQSPVVGAADPSYRVYVSVEDIAQITLIADPTEDGSNSDHADWGNAKFMF